MLKSDKAGPSEDPITRKRLRLWPGVIIVILQWLIWFGLPIIDPDATAIALFGGFFGGLAVVIWWAFFSRAARFDRWGAVVLMIVALAATSFVIHKSIATALMGMMFALYATPVLSLAFVGWAVATRRLSDKLRRVTMVATIFLATGLWTLLRTDGMTGDVRHDFAWRWAETAEERLLARADDDPVLPEPAADSLISSDSLHVIVDDNFLPVPVAIQTRTSWPGFRGPERNNVIHGTLIQTDWTASPPIELWRRPIGPGISSFAVDGDLLFTQEQRGEYEVVSCYRVATGEPVWRHRDSTRFWDSHAGAGPRSTPTFVHGRVYTFGATGILNVLNAANGAVFWSRNPALDLAAPIPGWGFASSPLVVDDVVIVAVAGTLAGYDLATGHPRWTGPVGGDSYGSPHLLTIGGIPQVLLLDAAGATSLAPADGKLLWQHPWPADTRILQPALIGDGDLLLSAGDGNGMRRIGVANEPGGWTATERWTSTGLKPYFSDFVIHNGYAFGFDGNILACIEIEGGKRQWKGGRYGSGQVVLLSDQNVLLVVSEKGELALVAAAPDEFTELARIPAVEGKTWNHPVLVGDVLLIRNGQEMVAFRLPLSHV